MNACRAGQLGQTADGILYFARSHHHQIRKLINDDDDLRQLLRFVLIFDILNSFNLRVVSFYVTHSVFGKLLVTIRHLCHCPV